VAVLGLGTWKRQLRGQSEYALAKRILRLSYQYREAIATVRYPAMWPWETASPPDEEANEMNERQKEFYGRSKGYEARWERVSSVRAELYPELLEAEVLWDKELTNLMEPIFQLEIDLKMATEQELKAKNPDLDPSATEWLRDPDFMNRRSELLYSGSKVDAFDAKFEEALAAASAFLKEYLRK
jgi:hypothetical protein